MKKKDLLKLLEPFPDTMEVCIFDHRYSLREDSGEGTTAGIYPTFEVAQMEKNFLPKGAKPWIMLAFDNPMIDDDLEERRCRVCGCTDNDCRQCIAKTGKPCYWVAEDLCSACANDKVVMKKEKSDGKGKKLRP